MSQESVDVIRRGYEAWNAGDVDAVRDVYDEGAIIVRGLEGWPEGADAIVGRDALMRQFSQVREALDVDTMEIREIVDAGDRVLVRNAWHGRGRGPDLVMEWSVIYTVRAGRIFLIEMFWDHDEALRAIELAE